MTDRRILMTAIEQCEGNKTLTDDQRLMILGKAIYDTAYQILKRISVEGMNYDASEEDAWLAEACWTQYKNMERVLTIAKRYNKQSGKKEEDFNKEWMGAITKMKSSVGNIVRDTRESNGKV